MLLQNRTTLTSFNPPGKVFFILAAGSFLLVFFYIPLFLVLKTAFVSGEGGFSLDNIIGAAASPYNRRIILFTLTQAALSTVFSVLLGLPGAWLLANRDFPGKRLIKAVSTVPFVLPSILVVLGFVIFFGNNGFLNRILMDLTNIKEPPLKILYTLNAIILAHGFYNFPIVIRIVSSLWEKLDPSVSNAARSLGARKIRLFFTVTLPQIMPAILAASSLIFIFCFTSFAIILVLGGGPAYTTLEVEIYRQARIALNMEAAAALAVTGIIITLVIMYINVHFQTALAYKENILPKSPADRTNRRFSKPGYAWAVLYVLIILVLVAAPVLSVVIKSFIQPAVRGGNSAFSITSYTGLFGGTLKNYGSTIIRAIRNSIFFASLTVIFSIPVGTFISYLTARGNTRGPSRLIDTILMMPLTVSSVIIGFGYLRMMMNLPEQIKSSPFLIIMAHTVIAYPFVVRSVTSVLGKLKPELTHAAMSLGAAPWKVFLSIELPLIKSAIFAGAAFSFAISIGEINATILLASRDTVTIPIAMYRLISSYNFYGACALGSILIILTIGAFLLMDYFGSEETTGGF